MQLIQHLGLVGTLEDICSALENSCQTGSVDGGIGELVGIHTIILKPNDTVINSLRRLRLYEEKNIEGVDGYMEDLQRVESFVCTTKNYTDDTARVKEVYLYERNLRGNVPSLEGLSFLERIDMYSNNLNGTGPKFSNLSHLIWVDFHDNKFTGNLPSLSHLSSLGRLVLGQNRYSGPIYTTIPDRLDYLDLAQNRLSGTLPDLSRKTNLSQIFLSYNNISGLVDCVLPQTLSTCSLTTNNSNSLLAACSRDCIPDSCRMNFTQGFIFGNNAQCSGRTVVSYPGTVTITTRTQTSPGSASGTTVRASTTSATTSSGTPIASMAQGAPVGAIVGGTVGGLAGLGLICGASLFLLRRRKGSGVDDRHRGAAVPLLSKMVAGPDPPSDESTPLHRGHGHDSWTSSHPDTTVNNSSSTNMSSLVTASNVYSGAVGPVTGVGQAHWFFLRIAGPAGLEDAQSVECFESTPYLVETRFTASSGDELTLVPGTFVGIQTVFRDGWGVVCNVETGQTGVVPLDCLRLAESMPSWSPRSRMESIVWSSARLAPTSTFRMGNSSVLTSVAVEYHFCTFSLDVRGPTLTDPSGSLNYSSSVPQTNFQHSATLLHSNTGVTPKNPRISSLEDVIVGAGSAGSILAARLSENPSISVLVLEAGVDNTDARMRMLKDQHTLYGSEHDWSFKTTPQPELHGRVISWVSLNGAFEKREEYRYRQALGGSSTLNAALYVLPDPRDFDNWPSSWSFSALEPYFRRVERLVTADGKSLMLSGRGTAGALPVTHLHKDTDQVHPFSRVLLSALERSTVAPFTSMINRLDINETPGPRAGLVETTTLKGVRCDAWQCWAQILAFVRTPSSHSAPDIEFHVAPTATKPLLVGPEKLGFMFSSVLLRPKSVGQLLLRSTDPFQYPGIEPNYLSNPDDLSTLASGLKIARRVAMAEELMPVTELLNSVARATSEDDEVVLEEHVRRTLSTDPGRFSEIDAFRRSPPSRNKRVFAGAGSGKSTSIISHVFHHIKSGEFKIEQFLIVVFNENACRDLRGKWDRLVLEEFGMLPRNVPLRIYTFHSLATKLCPEDHLRIRITLATRRLAERGPLYFTQALGLGDHSLFPFATYSIIVDEAQDCTMEFVVGDPLQRINGWNGADGEVFEGKLGSAIELRMDDYSLPFNWRCKSSQTLSFVNRVRHSLEARSTNTATEKWEAKSPALHQYLPTGHSDDFANDVLDGLHPVHAIRVRHAKGQESDLKSDAYFDMVLGVVEDYRDRIRRKIPASFPYRRVLVLGRNRALLSSFCNYLESRGVSFNQRYDVLPSRGMFDDSGQLSSVGLDVPIDVSTIHKSKGDTAAFTVVLDFDAKLGHSIRPTQQEFENDFKQCIYVALTRSQFGLTVFARSGLHPVLGPDGICPDFLERLPDQWSKSALQAVSLGSYFLTCWGGVKAKDVFETRGHVGPGGRKVQWDVSEIVDKVDGRTLLRVRDQLVRFMETTSGQFRLPDSDPLMFVRQEFHQIAGEIANDVVTCFLHASISSGRFTRMIVSDDEEPLVHLAQPKFMFAVARAVIHHLSQRYRCQTLLRYTEDLNILVAYFSDTRVLETIKRAVDFVKEHFESWNDVEPWGPHVERHNLPGWDFSVTSRAAFTNGICLGYVRFSADTFVDSPEPQLQCVLTDLSHVVARDKTRMVVYMNLRQGEVRIGYFEAEEGGGRKIADIVRHVVERHGRRKNGMAGESRTAPGLIR
ncbi:hypothetical protein HDU93_008132 [Gonapodya sp. JEL0774]|nr:hypothetical protein HDU93_008132 [Gonapodya sp. JEL0774]